MSKTRSERRACFGKWASALRATDSGRKLSNTSVRERLCEAVFGREPFADLASDRGVQVRAIREPDRQH